MPFLISRDPKTSLSLSRRPSFSVYRTIAKQLGISFFQLSHRYMFASKMSSNVSITNIFFVSRVVSWFPKYVRAYQMLTSWIEFERYDSAVMGHPQLTEVPDDLIVITFGQKYSWDCCPCHKMGREVPKNPKLEIVRYWLVALWVVIFWGTRHRLEWI